VPVDSAGGVGERSGVNTRVEVVVSQILNQLSSGAAASSLDGVVDAVARVRGRPITVVASSTLPPGVCGRWLARATDDLVEIHMDVPSKSFTTAHELGHMMLGHRGRSVVPTAAEASDVASPGLVEFMLTRGSDESRPEEAAQETEAEEFAAILMRRLRQAALSHVPAVQARLEETLS